MNKKIIAHVVSAIALLGTANSVLAMSSYVAPTGAINCKDCHTDLLGSALKPAVNRLWPTFTTMAIEMAKLTDYVASLKTTDTAPVLSPVNAQWNVTVGELPLSIPFTVKDTEFDPVVMAPAPGVVLPAGMKPSAITIKAATRVASFKLNWAPTAAQAGKPYPFTVTVKEKAAGRLLSSKAVKGSVNVWPARANAATAKTNGFEVLTAKWAPNTLTLTGKMTFKSTVTAAQKATLLATVHMNVKSASGVAIGVPVLLAPTAAGTWTKTITLTGVQVPCIAVSEFEGLKAGRLVIGAPAATCVK